MTPGESEPGERVIVAVSSNSSCKDAIRWALANKIRHPEDTLVFLHLVTRIPSPMGMEMYQSEVNNTMFVHYVRTIVQPMMLQLKRLVDPKVKLELKVGRNNSKEKGIVEEVKKLKATSLLLGTNARSVFGMGASRRGKTTSTGAYCIRAKPAGVSVYVIQKDKVVMSKESDGTSPDSSASSSPAGSGRLSLPSGGNLPRDTSMGSSGMLSPSASENERQFSRGSSHSSMGSGEVVEDGSSRASTSGKVLPSTAPASMEGPPNGRSSGSASGTPMFPTHSSLTQMSKGMSPAARLLISRTAKYGTWNGSMGPPDFSNEGAAGDSVPQSASPMGWQGGGAASPAGSLTGSPRVDGSSGERKAEMVAWNRDRAGAVTALADVEGRLAKARAALAAVPATLRDASSDSLAVRMETEKVPMDQSTSGVMDESDALLEEANMAQVSPIESALLKELAIMRKKADEAERARMEAERRAEQLMAAADLSLREVEAHNKRREQENFAMIERANLEAHRAMLTAEEARTLALLEAQKTEQALYQARSALELEGRKRREAEEKARKELSSRRSLRHYRQYTWEELKLATDNFKPERKLGEGGFGTVYSATLHHTPVAIKILKNTDALQAASEFQQEVEVLGQIQHPHTVMLLGCCPDKYALVYEYMANGSLEDRLACKDGTAPLPWYVRLRIAAEVSSALLILHTQPVPIVHRDLKPANILLDKNYVAKIGDVGLARLMPELNDNRTYMRESVPVGTFAYVDPEFQRTGEYGPKSDIYALGIVLLDLLTGRKPAVYEHLEEAVDEKDLDKLGSFLDEKAGRWPLEITMEVAKMAVRCSEMRRKKRPELEEEVLPLLEKVRDVAAKAEEQDMHRRFRPGFGDAPSSLFCPITQEMMVEPVLASDGHTYELVAIQQWLEKNDRSPMTNVKLPNKDLVPNHAVKSMIREFQERSQRAQ